MTKLRIGIIFGGRSEEHPVSLKSAREVAAHLDPERYEPLWIGITTAGRWLLCDGPDADLDLANLEPVAISTDPTVHGVIVDRDGRLESVRLDVVLPVLHGRFGEDGAVQGLLELSGIPYVGCDIASSAIAMDKALAYTVVRAAGIATPRFTVVLAGERVDPAAVDYPAFVKPARSGSSFGVTKVTLPGELDKAVQEARRFDTKVLIEQAIVGEEIGCALLGNGSDLFTGEVDRVALSHGFFRIHQENEPESGSQNATFIVPADIPDDAKYLVRRTAKRIYQALGCRGLARVDLFLLRDGTVMLNEVNTFPGLTSYSRYPRMMAASGLSVGDIVNRLVELALEEGGR
jgi:D-alanine--(R)-lactate ligase